MLVKKIIFLVLCAPATYTWKKSHDWTRFNKFP